MCVHLLSQRLPARDTHMNLQAEMDRVREYMDTSVKAPPNESCTCEWVILPLLWSAGYKHNEILSRASDPAGKYPDYTILPDTQFTWFLEAKCWNVDLQNDHVIQAMNYAHTAGKRWVILSNGREWRLYDDHIQGVEAGQRLVATAHLGTGFGLECFLNALSKQSVITGGVERYATNQRLSAILDTQLTKPDSEVIKALGNLLRSKLGLPSLHNSDIVLYFQADLKPEVVAVAPKQLALTKVPAISASISTCTSTTLTLDQLTVQPAKAEGQKPVAVSFEDGASAAANSWRDVALAVVKWIADAGKLPSIPFCGQSKGKRAFLNSTPQHLDGTAMKEYKELLLNSGTVIVHTNRSSRDFIACMAQLCQVTGIPSSQISVTIKA